MLLKDLLDKHSLSILDKPFLQTAIKAICCDSRLASGGSLFIALKGIHLNGNQFIHQAIEKGSRVIVSQEKVDTREFKKGVYFIEVKDPVKCLREATQKFYDFPSSKIRTMGVTGTNGKTTITFLLENILRYAGKKTAVFGTVNHRIGKKSLPSKNTTPGYLEIHQMLAQAVKSKIDYCIMEVSSHGLDQGRVDDINFRRAIFTNLTQDHLDYHKTLDNYFLAKAKLFQGLKPQDFAIINIDDDYGKKLLSMTKAKILTYAIKQKADIMAADIDLRLDRTIFTLIYPKGSCQIKSNLVGLYNVYNILAVIACALSEKVSIEVIKKGISRFRNAPGRLEKVENKKGLNIFIDYAHTPDALENVLTAIKNVTSSRIILIFGCGGDRDKTKRPIMGKIASELADFSYVTSDNPRSEEPKEIIEQIVQGFTNNYYKVIVDRKEAIRTALNEAKEGDVILIAGKGHENYQIIKNEKLKFVEKDIIREILSC